MKEHASLYNRVTAYLGKPWLTVSIGMLAIALVLQPIYFYGFASVRVPAANLIETLRSSPADKVLGELSAQSLLGVQPPSGRAAVDMADRLLAGLPYLPGFAGKAYVLPFSEVDMARNDGIGQLAYSSLYFPAVFLIAYEADGNPRYLEMARDMVVAYARFERQAWRQLGFLWNDHAVAARSGVLIGLWRQYRQSALYRQDDASQILFHAARCAALLSKDAHFTAATNHGVMQNIALLQLAAAFPGVLDADASTRLAMGRLVRQFSFYADSEGFVLEHSAGYHEEGVRLIGLAIRLAEMTGQDVPTDWRLKYARGQEVLRVLRRPDGTLPVFGDTSLEGAASQPSAKAPGAIGESSGQLNLYPLSGYGVWTFGKGTDVDSHSVLAWSNFRGHGHKLADDMSLVLWGHGRGWVTNIGYWGYFSWGRLLAEGWSGSNAPHWVGESPTSVRRTELLAYAKSGSAVMLSLRRTNSDGAILGRQVVALSNRVWLVLDTQAGASRGREVLWTFYPDLALDRLDRSRYLVRDSQGREMGMRIISETADISILRGSEEPFGGWVAMNFQHVPTSTVRIVMQKPDMVATVFSLGKMESGSVVNYANDSRWEASGPGWHAQRDGMIVNVQVGSRKESLSLVPPPDTHEERELIERNLKGLLDVYPRSRDLDHYRFRLAWVLAFMLLVQEALLVLVRRRAGRLRLGRARMALAGTWGLALLWLQLRYFVG